MSEFWRLTIAILAKMSILLLVVAGAPGVVRAQERLAPTKSIAQITIDDDGRPLYLPTSVFYDPTEEEIYLVNNGTARIVVYGPDFFPRISIGVGRGVLAPYGVFVSKNSQVYVAQQRNAYNPFPRVTILNAAFIPESEIFFDDIPGAQSFQPAQVAVSREGLIYVVGEAFRGVMVLDKDGTFLRWLRPMDMILDRAVIEATAREQAEQERLASEAKYGAAPEPGEREAVVAPGTERSRADIPEEFRPRSSRTNGDAASFGPGLGPVRINYVHIDSAGKLYLVSAETGKIYVHSPEEQLLFTFGEKGGTPRKLSQPYALTIDEKRGLIYVVDYMRQTIVTYDLDGKWVFEVGGRGSAPGWFYYPMDIAINRHGQIIVSDFFNRRIQVLEVQPEGVLSRFLGTATPETPAPEEAEGPVEPEGDVDAVPAPDSPGDTAPEGDGQEVPETIIEEVILPSQEPVLPVMDEVPAVTEPGESRPDEVTPATAPDEQPVESEGATEDAAGADPVEMPQTSEAHPRDVDIEEQVIPEQTLPVYPAEKQD
jgi:DNA-binding beta-propeller fold protein YncE